VVSGSLAAPAIELTQVSVNSETRGYWNVGWQVRNTGTPSLKFASVRLPHGQFKSPEKQFEPALDLAPGLVTEFKTLVYCDEPAGVVTENAFAIFNVKWRAEEWRIFVRMRIVVDAEGKPVSTSESVTTQKVGFSGVPN
jgi:hypothetical protein